MLAMKHEATHSVEVVVRMPIVVRFSFNIKESEHTLSLIKEEARDVAKERINHVLRNTIGDGDRIISCRILEGEIQSIDVEEFKFEELAEKSEEATG